MFIIRGKARAKDNTSRWVSVSLNERLSGSRGHVGGTRPGQTRKKPKDLSVREGEDRGCGTGGGVYVVCKCERVA